MRRFILLVVFLMPIVTIAQNNDPLLTLNEALTLSVTADSRASASFAVESEQVYFAIQAQSASEAFDPVLWLLDGNNQLVAYNDNADETGIAKISNLLLEADTYTVVVDSFNGVSEGYISLLVKQVFPFGELDTDAATSFTIELNLLSHTNVKLPIEFIEDAIVTITARDMSGNLDPYLTILDDAEIPLISNDDHQSVHVDLNILDAQISEWLVPATGTYYLEIRDFLGNSGQLILTVDLQS